MAWQSDAEMDEKHRQDWNALVQKARSYAAEVAVEQKRTRRRPVPKNVLPLGPAFAQKQLRRQFDSDEDDEDDEDDDDDHAAAAYLPVSAAQRSARFRAQAPPQRNVSVADYLRAKMAADDLAAQMQQNMRLFPGSQ